jgi:hypothetical protein
VRASTTAIDVNGLSSDTILYGFNDQVHYGGAVEVAAADGVAHPVWIDSGGTLDEEVDTAQLAAPATVR